MRSESWLILQTGTKTIPIIFQNHRFVVGPPTRVFTCFSSSAHYIFVNNLVTLFVWIIVPLIGKWQVLQITISFLHSCVIHLNNEYHPQQSIFHSDQACPDVIQAPNFHGMFMSVSSPMSKFMYINAFYVSVGVLKVHMLSYVHT
jgi:hypothetical protein